MRRLVVSLVVFPLGLYHCSAQTPTDTASLSALGGLLKPVILQHLPSPLYENSSNWGKQVMAAHHVEWRGLRPRIIKTLRNDGAWRKIRIVARNPAGNLELDFSNLTSDGTGRQTFKGNLSLLVAVEVEEQIWESGLRLYSGSARARLKLKLAMDCEATLRLEPGKSILPDTVFRLRVAKADVSYDDLVVEHVAGIGGSGANVMGDTLHSALKQWRPSIERELLAKANAAVVKAADTKEVRISLGKLFGQK